jgi:hypothetical protein
MTVSGRTLSKSNVCEVMGFSFVLFPHKMKAWVDVSCFQNAIVYFGMSLRAFCAPRILFHFDFMTVLVADYYITRSSSKKDACMFLRSLFLKGRSPAVMCSLPENRHSCLEWFFSPCSAFKVVHQFLHDCVRAPLTPQHLQ